MSDAQDLIRELMQKGWTVKEIANAVGRDSKMINYAARGEKPFANGVDALRQLTQSSTKDIRVEAPRRTRSVESGGGLANIRGGLARDLQNGRYVQATAKKGADFLLSELQSAAAAGRKINASVRFKQMQKREGDEKRRHANVKMYGKGAGDKRGYYASSLLARVRKAAGERGISESQALSDILQGDAEAAAEENYDEEANGGVEQFTMTAYDA